MVRRCFVLQPNGSQVAAGLRLGAPGVAPVERAPLEPAWFLSGVWEQEKQVE